MNYKRHVCILLQNADARDVRVKGVARDRESGGRGNKQEQTKPNDAEKLARVVYIGRKV